ncbi:MAG TPA: hypothetical protein VHO26_06545 [Propionibacteriaceae bacterium]|nr:hypothetical protein [Propionibacteriaceae bacterium]
MKLGQWFRRPEQADAAQRRTDAADDRVGEGADELQATREAIADTLGALSTQLEASRGQWDDQLREAYERMTAEWHDSLERMDATIARVRGADAG